MQRQVWRGVWRSQRLHTQLGNWSGKTRYWNTALLLLSRINASWEPSYTNWTQPVQDTRTYQPVATGSDNFRAILLQKLVTLTSSDLQFNRITATGINKCINSGTTESVIYRNTLAFISRVLFDDAVNWWDYTVWDKAEWMSMDQ